MGNPEDGQRERIAGLVRRQRITPRTVSRAAYRRDPSVVITSRNVMNDETFERLVALDGLVEQQAARLDAMEAKLTNIEQTLAQLIELAQRIGDRVAVLSR